MRTAMVKRAQPGIVMPAYFFKSHAVSGHAEMPENKANQPLVIGSGPRVIIRPRPPIPATIVHAQATKKPSVRPNWEMEDGSWEIGADGEDAELIVSRYLLIGESTLT